MNADDGESGGLIFFDSLDVGGWWLGLCCFVLVYDRLDGRILEFLIVKC